MQDAIDHGWDLTDIDKIRDEKSPEEYDNLYGCQFIKSCESAFDYNRLLACGADGYDDWPDWRPYASRPMADRPVWIGYNPNGASGKGDSGAISINAVPMVAGGKFRTVETLRIRGMEFEEQANLIIGMLSRYNVQHIGIDGTGIGEAVYQLVKKHFPAAVCYQFSPASKRMLVLKMQQLVRGGCWEYDR